MTKKDYELIAGALSIAKPAEHNYPSEITDIDTYRAGRRHQWVNTCKTMADVLETTNTRFDRSKFITACGVEV